MLFVCGGGINLLWRVVLKIKLRSDLKGGDIIFKGADNPNYEPAMVAEWSNSPCFKFKQRQMVRSQV